MSKGINNASNTNSNDYITRSNWHSGAYRYLNCTKTLDGYYSAVADFVKREGKPIGKTMLLVRNCKGKEVDSKNWGASWTTNLDVCEYIAKQRKSNHILMTLVHANELAVHFDVGEDVGFYEEEYVLDIMNHDNPILHFEMFCEIEGKKDWCVIPESDDYKTIEGYLESQPELLQALYRKDDYCRYMSSLEEMEKDKKKAVKALKIIRNNKALGISTDFTMHVATPKSGVVTKEDLIGIFQDFGVANHCNAVMKDGNIPGTKRLIFMRDSKEIIFTISSRLAKVLFSK